MVVSVADTTTPKMPVVTFCIACPRSGSTPQDRKSPGVPGADCMTVLVAPACVPDTRGSVSNWTIATPPGMDYTFAASGAGAAFGASVTFNSTSSMRPQRISLLPSQVLHVLLRYVPSSQ